MAITLQEEAYLRNFINDLGVGVNPLKSATEEESDEIEVELFDDELDDGEDDEDEEDDEEDESEDEDIDDVGDPDGIA